MEKINKQRNMNWKGLKTSSSALPVAASCINTSGENNLLVLKKPYVPTEGRNITTGCS